MNLLEMLNGANGGQSVAALAQQFGISEEQVQSVMGQLVPALAVGALLSRLAHHRINARSLRVFVMGFSIVSGLVLLLRT